MDVPSSFVSSAGVGCHIELDVARARESSWMLGAEAVDLDEYSDDAVFPDVAIDVDASDGEEEEEEEGADAGAPRLSATNAGGGDVVKVAYITVYDVVCVGKGGKVLAQGATVDNDGQKSLVTTFIVLVPPRAMAHLCRLRLDGKDVRDVRIDSDFRPWSMHPKPFDTHTQSVAFPLQGDRFLCTQSEGGELTHFFAGNLHAVDFRCDVGTPIVAAGDGVVVEVNDSNTLTGIAVSNLFKWNSIVIQLDAREESRSAGATCSTANTDEHASSMYDIRGGDLFVEYVHIRAKSARVKVGDRVTRGQVLCESGGVGFSPEPHLHFTAFRSSQLTADTVRVFFEAERDGTTYIPRAGAFYNAETGQCS